MIHLSFYQDTELLMNVEDWLRAAIADAEARNLPQLKPLLESLALSTRRLREADEKTREGAR
ncbi:MAG TPA: hypothetical protein VGD94_19440 [Vicinamibacterales bacterium]